MIFTSLSARGHGLPIALFALGMISPAFAGRPIECPKESFRGKVTRVSDGDTIRVADRASKQEYPIRLLSIDTPETHYQGKTQGYWGDKASARLARLLPLGTEVTVGLDVDRCDVYGRVLGYVFKGREFINERMAEEALAVNYCIYPNVKYCDRLEPIVRRNIERKAGMFGDSSLQLPYDFRRIESGRPYEKYIGNIETHAVLEPGRTEEVPVAQRVFFMTKEEIRSPYYLAKGR